MAHISQMLVKFIHPVAVSEDNAHWCTLVMQQYMGRVTPTRSILTVLVYLYSLVSVHKTSCLLGQQDILFVDLARTTISLHVWPLVTSRICRQHTQDTDGVCVLVWCVHSCMCVCIIVTRYHHHKSLNVQHA